MTRILKSTLLTAGLLAFAGLAHSQIIPSVFQTGAGQLQDQPLPAFTHPNSVAQDLARLDLALNNTGTLSARFTQSNAEGGQAFGALSLKRPGKIRFDYDDPNPILIISDGVTITQIDEKLGTSDRIPLKSTPLDFFLKSDLSLARDTKVVALQRFTNQTRVTVEDGKGKTAGQMTLVFNEPNLALLEWTVIDEYGTTTRVELSNLVYNQEMNPRLFQIRNERNDRRRRE
jgi:outer membrane lipoprotein-sorting protein